MQGGPALPAARQWFKSSYSGANTTECVEACPVAEGIAIRDSKHATGPVIPFAPHPWAAFLHALRASDRPRRPGQMRHDSPS
ncbi:MULTISPECIES: DUF397 domain-containing protein [unclassified Streptomyces]|uniref:DUF397 domain-containing protein n=1 Tax=unclassified Streptomyces TaxID=2593676 RepID=UPI00278C2A6D|nr:MULTISPECIES: DUF397 domain-containing protein [unclassified Streptomyces]